MKELKAELRSGENRSRNITYVGHPYFWSGENGDFAQAANEVHAEKSPMVAALFVAQYLGSRLPQFPAIEILFLAHHDGVLDLSGRKQLIRYLHEQQRFAESIPLLEPLVTGNPNNIQYLAALLMAAYYRSQRQEQLLQLVQETDITFTREGAGSRERSPAWAIPARTAICRKRPLAT